jgi:hypothetical protein
VNLILPNKFVHILIVENISTMNKKAALSNFLHVIQNEHLQKELEAWLDLLHRAINTLAIQDDDPRVGFGLRARRKVGFTMNINQRRALAFLRYKGEVFWEFIINDEDLQSIIKLPGYLRHSGLFAKGKPARLVAFSPASKPYQSSKLLEAWDKALADSLVTGKGSPFKKYHLSLLFRGAEKPEARKLLLDWVHNGDPSESELAAPEVRIAFGNAIEQIVPVDDILSGTELPEKSEWPLSLNTILYGPPGTGKTYSTIGMALEILGEDIIGRTRAELRALFDRYQKEGRIAFITFHQSMSYEDFIEGIKPQEPRKEDEGIAYRIEDGIFKRLVEKADTRMGNFLEVVEKFKQEISEADGKTPLPIKSSSSTFNVTYRSGSMFYIRPHNSTKEDAWYPVSIDNIEKFHNTENPDGIYNITYVRGIHQFLVKERNLKKGRESNRQTLPYVLIIDEINRGNVSQIFGELITLIEKDKRLGNKESLEITLPYSKKPFGVPPNLYLIGTMNTADRSVEALDTALRRRFSFVEMPPRSELLSPESMYLELLWEYEHGPWDDPDFIEREYALFDFLGAGEKLRQEDTRYQLWDKMQKEGKQVQQAAYMEGLFEGPLNLQHMLDTINHRIEVLLDRDHRIGHAYFMGIATAEDPLEALKTTFQKNIIPLLQEYFYGDYAKIGAVLGEAFVGKEAGRINKETFAKGSWEIDAADYRPVFRLRDVSLFTDTTPFIDIYAAR